MLPPATLPPGQMRASRTPEFEDDDEDEDEAAGECLSLLPLEPSPDQPPGDGVEMGESVR
jgi:hypothetical protein